MEEISMIAEPSTTSRLNKKSVKNIHGRESDNLWENEIYGSLCSRFRYQLVKAFWGKNFYLSLGAFPVFLLPPASKPAALEPGGFLQKTATLSKTDKQLH